MKKCLICGEENQDISKYCHMCGFKFVGSEESIDEVVIQKPIKREFLKKRRNPLLVKKNDLKMNKDMVFVCIIIVLLVGFAFFYKSNSKSKNINHNDITRALQMYEQKQRQQSPSSSWDFQYKNDFAPESKKPHVDFFE